PSSTSPYTLSLHDALPILPLEERFLELLSQAPSNLPHLGNAAEIYKRWIKHMVVDLRQVGAHYALSCMFLPSEGKTSIFCYDVEDRKSTRLNSSHRTISYA